MIADGELCILVEMGRAELMRLAAQWRSYEAAPTAEHLAPVLDWLRGFLSTPRWYVSAGRYAAPPAMPTSPKVRP